MEQASDGIFVAGVDGRFEEVNAAGCAMLGYTLEELQAMRPGDLIDPADLSGNPLHIDDVMAGEVVITERNLRRKNGSLVPVEISSRRLDDGRVQGIVRDISGRRRSEEALRQSEERLRDLVHNARDAILTLDIEGRFTSANRAAERLLGFKTGELMGCDLADLAAGGAIESVSRLVDTTDTSQSSIRELSLRTHDGRQIWLEATRRVIRRDGKPVEVHVIARDVTERRELQEQLWQSQKMDAIGRLAGGVAHDLNNLLTVISCYNDLTLKRAAEGAPGHREAIGIRQACERAARLTRQLLTFSRKTVSEPRSVDINGVVEQMRDMLGRLIGEHIRLRTATDPALGSVRLDAGQLEQIIVNLAINARDAMPEGGVLTIATAKLEPGSSIAGRMMAERSAKCALLVVSDTGIGMDADTQSRAFEPFFTTKEAGKGTGLGLSTVYGIVNQAGGMVRLQSEPGRGTRVEVYLPTSEAVVYRAGVDSRGRPSGGTETVLVVEDEEMVRQLVCEVLQGAGFTVLEASNGREAMRLMEATSSAIDLVVTDVIMPEMSGSELAKQLERSRPEIKILFMSGYTDDAIIHHGVLEEGLEFLAKPFSPDELLARVRGVLDAR
jgi:PAS domain S-box-containing protein